MRHSLTKTAAFALVAPLAGALLFSAAPASAAPAGALAAPAVAQVSTVKVSDPFSVFDINLKATKKVKPGGLIKYSLTATNEGPYEATAGTWFIGGIFPKGVDLKKIKYNSSVDETICALDGRELFCLVLSTVNKGEYVQMNFYAKTKKNAKGTQTATLGVVSYDVQTGMENLSKQELDRIGMPSKAYSHSVKTRIVR